LDAPVILDAAFWVVCLVVIAAGAAKLAEPGPLASLLGNLAPWLSRRNGAAVWSARVVGAVEIVSGLSGLALGGPWSAGAVGALYLAFAAAVVVARRRRLPSCGCFGTRSSPPSVAQVVTNLVSAAVCVAAVLGGVEPVADGVAGRSATGVLVVLGVLCAALAIIVIDTGPWRTTVSPVPRSRGDDGRR
jgi:hypothetical protein